MFAVMAKRDRVFWQLALAKCLALLKANEFSNDMGLTNAVLEGDALSIVQAIQKVEEDLSWLGHHIEESKSFLAYNPSWDI